MRFFYLGLLCWLALGLQSCGLNGGDIPADHYYRLAVIEPIEPQLEPQAEKFQQLLIKPVIAAGLYHERSLLYVESDTPLEIRRYHYHYWVEPPARLVEKYLLDYLDQSAITNELSIGSVRAKADVIVSSQLLHFERLVSGSDIKVLVVLQMGVEYPADGARDWSKIYRIEKAADSQTVHGSIRVFTQALQLISQQLVADLNKK